MTDLTCGNNGCQMKFKEEENNERSCVFHPGGPVFHEGLKGWSCCSKRVVNFDDFLTIPGCSRGCHKVKDKAAEEEIQRKKKLANEEKAEKELLHRAPLEAGKAKEMPKKPLWGNNVSLAEAIVPQSDEDDEEGVCPQAGTKCFRNACESVYTGPEMERSSDECRYHPGEPIFHEGSKGWFCCKRRVLEFNEFLKIEGCRTGKHKFTPFKKKNEAAVQTECRLDWYQTPKSVNMSIFAKKVDKEKSVVIIEEPNLIKCDLFFEGNKHFKKDIVLSQAIISSESKFEILGTKVELNLKKANSVQWDSLQ